MKKVFELMATLKDPEQQQLLRDIVGDISAPDGFDSWRDAAIAERVKRVEVAEKLRELESTLNSPDGGPCMLVSADGKTHKVPFRTLASVPMLVEQLKILTDRVTALEQETANG